MLTPDQISKANSAARGGAFPMTKSMTPDEAKASFGSVSTAAPAVLPTDSPKIAALRASAHAADAEANRANSPLGIAADTALETGKNLVSGTIGTGESLGQAAAASDVTKNVSEGDTGVKDMQVKVLKQIAADKAAGRDTTHLQTAYNSITSHGESQGVSDILPALDKSNLQVLLEAGSMGLEAISGAGVGPAKTAAEAVAKPVGEAVGTAVQGVKDSVEASQAAAKSAKALEDTRADLQTINEMITPKPTPGQAKTALDEGRLFAGSKGTLLKEGTLDKVATTAQQADSTRTIQRLIPDAAKMDEPTLYGALDEKVTEVAQKLEPTMKATPISNETEKAVNDAWKETKAAQIEASDGTKDSLAIIKKSQANVEAILSKIKPGKVNDIIERARLGRIDGEEFVRQMTERGQQIESTSMDDLWQAAKNYDKSVPKNVKNATDLSPEKLQLQKTLWLQNRAVLRGALTDATNGLGKDVQQAFKDMTDMYEAQTGIMTKAQIAKEGAPSLIDQGVDAIKKHKIITTLGAADVVKHTVPGMNWIPLP